MVVLWGDWMVAMMARKKAVQLDVRMVVMRVERRADVMVERKAERKAGQMADY
jgi:accessory colonization factor AcfC